MKITSNEEKLIRAIREAGTDISFLLIHMSNLYDKQAELDLVVKRENATDMQHRANLYMKAYHEVKGIKMIGF